MRKGDLQLGIPQALYKGDKADIEALTGVPEGAVAYATDDNEFGSYDGATWTWGQSGGGSPDWGDISGTLSDQTDLQTALDAKLDDSMLDTDGTLAANSDAKIASQKATKTYVDNAVTGLWDFKGATDCSANPNYPAALKGDAYVVSVAGKIGGASGKSVDVSDIYVAIADNAGGTEASVGTSWVVLEHNLVGALLASNNLSDVANALTARTNLGLSDADIRAIASVITQSLHITGEITPTTLHANTNDYNPTGLSTASVIRQNVSNNYTITGLAGGALGRVIILYNINTGSDIITLADEDTSSTDVNRFDLRGNVTVRPDEGVILFYDNTDQRWRMLCKIPDETSHTHSSYASTSHTHSAYIPTDGWIPGTGTWSYSSADSPTFVASVPDADAAVINPGWRIKLTQTSAKYFLVTAKGSPSGGFTPVTIYGGTDYTLANAAISSPYFSPAKSPLGFPMDPDKWTITVVNNTSNVSQSSPTGGTWYNLGSLSGSIHIGAWRVFYELALEVNDDVAAAVNFGVRCTLSTTTNSETEATMTGVFTGSVPAMTGALVRATIHREKIYNLASKTTHYLLANTGVVGATSINFRGDSIATTLKAVSAYL